MFGSLSVKARSRSLDGFTLIELLVVVLIIGILAAIAVPTFLGQRARAQDRSAQSDLRNTLVAAKTIYVDKQTYADVPVLNDPDVAGLVAALGDIEPALDFVRIAPTDAVEDDALAVVGRAEPLAPGEVGIAVSLDGARFYAVALSASGKVFALSDDADSATGYAEFADIGDADTYGKVTGATYSEGGW